MIKLELRSLNGMRFKDDKNNIIYCYDDICDMIKSGNYYITFLQKAEE